jgi:hypothetical protein
MKDGGGERAILTPDEFLEKESRDAAYVRWINRFKGLTPKPMNWQLIRVHGTKHSSNQRKLPWWDRFQDCVFRVFTHPQGVYDRTGWQQWYLICPEDCELVNRHRLREKGVSHGPRSPLKEKWISASKDVRKALLIPVECCKHYRHETTAGVLPEGL